LLPLVAAVSQRGMRPRPVQVLAYKSGIPFAALTLEGKARKAAKLGQYRVQSARSLAGMASCLRLGGAHPTYPVSTTGLMMASLKVLLILSPAWRTV